MIQEWLRMTEITAKEDLRWCTIFRSRIFDRTLDMYTKEDNTSGFHPLQSSRCYIPLVQYDHMYGDIWLVNTVGGRIWKARSILDKWNVLSHPPMNLRCTHQANKPTWNSKYISNECIETSPFIQKLKSSILL